MLDTKTALDMDGAHPIIAAQEVVKRIRMGRLVLTILDDVSLSVSRGDSLAIVGESGSGKTTLLGILAGLDLPSSGRVWLDEQELTAMDEEERAKVRSKVVGFVFQSFQLIESLTALENVMLPGELRGESTARADAERFLERVGVGERTKHYPRQLSGGEQQRVAIARAFASKPTVLFADEPTGNLDTATGRLIAELLFDLNKELSTTLVLVTHDTNLASMCEHRIELAAGRIVR